MRKFGPRGEGEAVIVVRPAPASNEKKSTSSRLLMIPHMKGFVPASGWAAAVLSP